MYTIHLFALETKSVFIISIAIGIENAVANSLFSFIRIHFPFHSRDRPTEHRSDYGVTFNR